MKFSPSIALSVCFATLTVLTAAPAFAQSTTADASADMVPRSSVERVADLRFGDIVPGSSASTIVVNPFTQVRSLTSGNAIPMGGTVSAAQFRVNARALLFYQIVLPASATLTRSGGSETMTVTNFTLDGSAIRLLPLFTSIGNFKVGGRLNVGANQVGGAYSGNFTVTVNYL